MTCGKAFKIWEIECFVSLPHIIKYSNICVHTPRFTFSHRQHVYASLTIFDNIYSQTCVVKLEKGTLKSISSSKIPEGVIVKSFVTPCLHNFFKWNVMSTWNSLHFILSFKVLVPGDCDFKMRKNRVKNFQVFFM